MLAFSSAVNCVLGASAVGVVVASVVGGAVGWVGVGVVGWVDVGVVGWVVVGVVGWVVVGAADGLADGWIGGVFSWQDVNNITPAIAVEIRSSAIRFIFMFLLSYSRRTVIYQVVIAILYNIYR